MSDDLDGVRRSFATRGRYCTVIDRISTGVFGTSE